MSTDDLVAFLTARLNDDEAMIEALDDPQAFPQGIFYQSDPKAVVVQPWAGPKTYVYLWWASTGLRMPDWKWVLGDGAVQLLSPELLAKARADVTAKRAMIASCVETLDAEDAHDYVLHGGTGEEYDLARYVLVQLAAVWQGHPDWREDWRA